MKVRPYVDDDAPNVAALISAEEKRLYGARPGGVTGDDIRMFLQVAKEAWIWEDGRGTTRVTLDVDAQNETGAVRLYERVGMVVETCGVAFEKAGE